MTSRVSWLGAAMAALLLAGMMDGRPAKGGLLRGGGAEELPVLVPQYGHSGWVTAIAASPDRRLLATGGNDGSILVWEPERGRVLTSLSPGSGKEILALAFQGRAGLAFVAQDLTRRGNETLVSLWDLAAGRAVRTFKGHPPALALDLAISPGGTLLAASGAGRVTVWRLATGELLLQLPASGAVSFLDERRMIFQAADSMLVMDPVSGPPALRALPTGEGQCFAVSRDGSTLAHGRDSQVSFWDLRSGARIASQELLLEARSLIFYGEKQGLVAVDRSGHVYRLRGERWQELVGLLDLGKPLTAAAALDGDTIATGRLLDGTVTIWAVDAVAPLRRLGFPSPAVTALDLSGDGSILVAGDAAGKVRVWDLAAGVDWAAEVPEAGPLSGKKERLDPGVNHVEETFITGSVPFPDQAPVRSVRLTASNRLTVVRSRGQVEVWDLEYHRRLFSFSSEGARDGLIWGEECLIVAGGGEIQRYKMADGSRLEARRAPSGTSAFALASDGGQLAVSGSTEVVVFDRLWREVRRFPSLNISTDARIQFLAGGMALIRASTGGVQRLDLGTGRVRREASAGDSATALAGREELIFTTAGDGRIRSWVSGADTPFREVMAHPSRITCLALSRNGKVLVSGGEDATLQLWHATSMQLLARVELLPGFDWLASSPSGFFDGTASAWSLASFQFPSEPMRTYAPEQFFSLFFQPGLLRDIVAQARPIEQILASRRDPRASRQLGAFRHARIPEVRILSPGSTVSIETGRGGEGEWTLGARTLRALSPSPLGSVKVMRPQMSQPIATLKAEVRDAGSGARDCRVFQNQTLIYERLGPFPVTAARRTGRLRLDFDVLAGSNELSVYCFNDMNVRSEIARVTVDGAAALLRKGRAFVVGAGIDGYGGGLQPLRYAEADATEAVTDLVASLDGTGSYTQIVPLLLLGREATKGNLVGALDRLAGRTGTAKTVTSAKLAALSKVHLDDTVVIFFAGHGSAHGDLYTLFPVDASAGPRPEGGLSDRELEAALRGINAGHLLLILDTCQAGQLLDSDEDRRGPLNVRGFAQLAYEKRMQVMAASQNYQSAFEATRYEHGLLTFALFNEGLRGFLAEKETPGDRPLRADEWLHHAQRRVPGLQRDLARGEAFFGSEGSQSLRFQQPQLYLPVASEETALVIAIRKPAGVGTNH